MKIGIITQAYYPIKGGVTEHVHATAEELRRRGHDVTIITAYFNRGDEEWSDGVERIGRDLTLPINSAFVNVTIGLRLRWDLRRLAEKHQFDLLHIHNPLDPVLPMLSVLTLPMPKVGTFHTSKPSSFGFALFRKPIEQRVNQRLSVRIAVSEAAKQFYGMYFQGPWEIIPNGVDVARFHPEAKPMPRFTDGKPNILFVGRMDPRKGVHIILDAFTRIAERVPESRLLIVGGGILIHHYKRFIPVQFAHRIHFLNYVSREDLPRYYATADICCFPAYGRESFGIVLAEAMASGKPVVASNIPGYAAVMDDGVTGLLAEKGNPKDFSEKLISLLGDSAARQRMGSAGRKKAETLYAWPRIVDQLEEKYLQAIAAPKKG